jgi:hypothetical protein
MRYAYIRAMTDDAQSTNAYAGQAETRKETIVSLRIPPELNEQTAIAAQAVGLKKSDVMRLALKRGIERLMEQLEAKPADQ